MGTLDGLGARYRAVVCHTLTPAVKINLEVNFIRQNLVLTEITDEMMLKLSDNIQILLHI